MAQYARPSSDIAVNNWTSTPLYQKIDEAVASDADYIQKQRNTLTSCEVGLSSVTDPQTSSGHVVRFRYRADNNFGTIQVSLYQGATLIASQTVDPGENWLQSSFTLTAAEADSITNYADLRLRFTLLGNTYAFIAYYDQISWAELEVPDVPAPMLLESVGILRAQ